MKNLVVLTGASGIGKTTSFIPAFVDKGYTAIETGDLFKSVIGSIRDGGFGLNPDAYCSDELPKYLKDLPGRANYECDWKQEVGDVQSCYAFEVLRCVVPDFHCRSVFTVAKALSANKVITSCINQEEMEILLRLAAEDGWECVVVRLGCANPSRPQVRRERVTTDFLEPPVLTIDSCYSLNEFGVQASIDGIFNLMEELSVL